LFDYPTKTVPRHSAKRHSAQRHSVCQQKSGTLSMSDCEHTGTQHSDTGYGLLS